MSNNKTVATIKQAIDSFLLSCKVKGKSNGTVVSSYKKYSPIDNLRT